jgi:transcriptional regulator with XRE-family HTH domain
MTTTRKLPLRTKGFAWGHKRVQLGVSMRQLEAASGINRSMLSLAEAGRLVPTGTEYDAVMAALAAVEANGKEGSSGTQPAEPSATMGPADAKVLSPQQ